MRIYSERGKNDIFFQFTEHKFENKINAFFRYAKQYTKKFYQKKRGKIDAVYIKYEFGYKTKEPETYYTTDIVPDFERISYDKTVKVPLTSKRVIDYAIQSAQVQFNYVSNRYKPEQLGIYYLRGIQINYIYKK